MDDRVSVVSFSSDSFHRSEMVLSVLLLFLLPYGMECTTTVNAAVILVTGSNLSADYRNIAPALDVAFAESYSRYGIKFVPWKATYEGYCNEALVLRKVYEAVNRTVDLIIGPSCANDLVVSSKLVTTFGIPIITGAAESLESTKDFPYTSRLCYNYYSQWSFFVLMCTKYRWTNVAIIYDTQERLFQLNAMSLVRYLYNNGMKGNLVEMNGNEVISASAVQDLLDAAKAKARVVVLLVTPSRIRQVMLQAYRMNMANGEYAFLAVDMFQQGVLGGYGWQQNDLFDTEARLAYKPLFVLTLMDLQRNPHFRVFEKRVRNQARSADSTLLNESLAEKAETFSESNSDPSTMYDILNSKFNNRTFSGGALGPVLFNPSGDSISDFQLYQMSKHTPGAFAVVAEYSGYLDEYKETSELTWMSKDNTPPANEPRCGYDGYKPICLEEARYALAGALGGIIGCLLIGTVAGVLIYRVIKSRAELNNLEWVASWQEISFHRQMTSERTSASSLKTIPVEIEAEAPALRTMRAAHISASPTITRDSSITKNSSPVATFRNQLVLIRTCPNITVGLNRNVRNEVRLVKSLVSENLCKFIAACIDPEHTCVLLEYCSRGSLQDVLYNDRLTLDWVFRLSFMNDIIRGLTCIQESLMLKHGRLSSQCCFVDKRFVLKVGDFGLDSFYRKNSSIKVEPADLLWTAPELLRAKEFARPTPESDCYSFAIILSEIILRESPFFQNKTNYEDIIYRVQRGQFPPFRPIVEDPSCHSEIIFIMRSCWAENPSERLKLSQVRSCLRSLGKATGYEKVSIIDTLLERMEQHTQNLESTVEEKTQALLDEKKKTDQLLYSILPKHAAEQLKRGERVLPESYDSVTIYFGDIVGFTTLCSESTPTEIVNLMNDLYSRFDHLIEKFDAYKVETIGDCYVVVSGLPHRNGHRHAPEIARLAFALRACITSFDVRHKPSKKLQLRIGMNSGPCVAGVVGFATPRYCLFGDTVNVASRMESTGEAMKIQITQATCNLLHAFGNFRTEFRGKVNIKGKGEMSIYWLLDDSELTQ